MKRSKDHRRPLERHLDADLDHQLRHSLVYKHPAYIARREFKLLTKAAGKK